jgi:hypothetical protein
VIKKLKNFFFQQDYYEIFRLVDGKFQPVFKVPPFDWCLYLSGKKFKMNPFFRLALNCFEQTAPEFIHPCPYEGVIQATNITASRAGIIMFPSGTFKSILRTTDGHKNIFGFVLQFTFL